MWPHHISSTPYDGPPGRLEILVFIFLDVPVRREKKILCQTAEILSQLQEQERQEWEKREKKERLSRSLLSMLEYTVQDTDEEREKNMSMGCSWR